MADNPLAVPARNPDMFALYGLALSSCVFVTHLCDRFMGVTDGNVENSNIGPLNSCNSPYNSTALHEIEQRLNNSISNHTTLLQSVIEGAQENITTGFTVNQTVVIKDVKALNEKVLNSTKALDSVKAHVVALEDNLSTGLDNFKKGLITLSTKDELSKLNDSTKELIREETKQIEGYVNTFKSHYEDDMNKLTQMFDELSAKHEDLKILIDKISEKSGMPAATQPDGPGRMFKSSDIPSILIQSLINVILVVLVCSYMKGQPNAQPPVQQNSHGSQVRPKVEASGMDRSSHSNHRPVASSRQLSVIAFSDSTVDDARTFLRSMSIDFPPYHVIRDPSEMDRITPCKGFLVVIGYDGRNSIVEDMDDTHGSKKRETLRKIREMGAEVIVMYIDNDISSGSLTGRDLYHQKLQRPRTHPVLIPLTEKDQFLSIHRGQLTKHQQSHVKGWISRL